MKKKLNKKQRRQLKRILIGGALFLLGALLPLPGSWSLLLYLPAYIVVGGDVLRRAVQGVMNGQMLDENFLMVVATIGAFALGLFSEGSYYSEGVGVMLFYQVGTLFESVAVGQSRKSIAALMDIRPDYANIEVDGHLQQVDPESVKPGQVIVVEPGERIPLDGTVLEGNSSLDTAALTGEAVPRDVAPGDEAVSGCVNLSGLLKIRVEREYGQSTVARILDLVENASSKKAKAENFITKFARWYTPLVVGSALVLALVLPFAAGLTWAESISRALIFLVVSCPCALVISIPLSFFGGIGGASRCGILIKGGNYLEALAKVDTVVFDKTGTLTRGSFQVQQVEPASGFDRKQLLETAALVESYSNHPISRSLRAAVEDQLDSSRVTQVEEIAGRGVRALVDGQPAAVGNAQLMQDLGLDVPAEKNLAGTVVYAALDGKYAGFILIADEIKPDAQKAIAGLKAQGVRRTVMLSGDREAAARQVAERLGMDEVHAELLPADKVERVDALLNENERSGKLVFVGDGINDAPVLSRADIGIAMGALGSDAAIEAADVVLMDDKPSKIALAIRIGKKAHRIVNENIVFALGVKLLVMVLGALGKANLWAAVFGDVGVSVIAILNASRMLRIKDDAE